MAVALGVVAVTAIAGGAIYYLSKQAGGGGTPPFIVKWQGGQTQPFSDFASAKAQADFNAGFLHLAMTIYDANGNAVYTAPAR